jgi:hypothetical protein
VYGTSPDAWQRSRRHLFGIEITALFEDSQRVGTTIEPTQAFGVFEHETAKLRRGLLVMIAIACNVSHWIIMIILKSYSHSPVKKIDLVVVEYAMAGTLEAAREDEVVPFVSVHSHIE